MKLIPIFVALLCAISAAGQTYPQELAAWQQHYKNEFLTDANSPLKASDTGYLRFYAPNELWHKQAVITLTPAEKPFGITTHKGTKKMYRQYGILTFAPTAGSVAFTLRVYESMKPIPDTAYRDYLFLPFFDLTNYETTYGGGRYLDLRVRDIQNNRITVDFNKAYNPYCAFGEGYACPIPPAENKLTFRIEAGEELFAKPVKE